ncbi:MAG: hypothetical protein KJ566_00755 [Nanoarchaeota archaeon]|nr:hypothetical protein [Nanoarchaeota archaeon]
MQILKVFFKYEEGKKPYEIIQTVYDILVKDFWLNPFYTEARYNPEFGFGEGHFHFYDDSELPGTLELKASLKSPIWDLPIKDIKICN